MMSIEIYLKGHNSKEILDKLNDIATRVKKGDLSGNGWEIIGESENTIDA